MVSGTRPSPYEYEKRKMREAAVPNADGLANRIDGPLGPLRHTGVAGNAVGSMLL